MQSTVLHILPQRLFILDSKELLKKFSWSKLFSIKLKIKLIKKLCVGFTSARRLWADKRAERWL